MSDKTVYRIGLSVAHYKKRPGAGYNGVHENELSEKWTKLVRKILTKQGHHVFTPFDGNLRSKVKYLNNNHLDVALEIHFNGSGNPKVSGVETLFHPKSFKGKLLADHVHNCYAKLMGIKDRGIKEGWYKMDRPGVNDYIGDIDGDEHPDYFLAKTNCPALILEPDFIARQDNINDKMEVACEGIAKGIITYFDNL